MGADLQVDRDTVIVRGWRGLRERLWKRPETSVAVSPFFLQALLLRERPKFTVLSILTEDIIVLKQSLLP